MDSIGPIGDILQDIYHISFDYINVSSSFIMVARGSCGVYLVLWEPLDILAKKSEMVYTVTAHRISPLGVPLGGVSIQKGPWGCLSRP